MRKKIIAGNWKMNKTPREAEEFLKAIIPELRGSDADVIFCVPYVSLDVALRLTAGTGISVGAQNLHFEDSGAFTGEISAKMLREMGVEYVIIGHSERREYFAETDDTVNKKVKKALEYGLLPIVCVGEGPLQRERGVTLELVRKQVKLALFGIPGKTAEKVTIAYEPIWAIGTGKTATSEQAGEVCSGIRQVLSELYGGETAEKIRVQYGGSVTEKNAAELFAMADIDGGLVGGASLKPEFKGIVKY